MSALSSTNSANENGFKAFVKKNPLLSMFGLMFLLAWPYLILEALASRGWASKPPDILGFATGWVPALATIIVASILAGRSGVKEVFRRFLIWRVGFQWYIVGIFLLAALILGGIGLHVLFGGATPVMPIAGASLLEILFAFTVTMLLGALINTEEIALRGFALPRLQARHSVLLACLYIAIPESLFHLPYFWNKDVDFYQTVGMFWFTAFNVALVFIYAYVFNTTKGSLIIVTLMHASQNAWANLLSDNSARPFQFTVALAWMIALALIFLTKGQLGYESE